MNNRLLSSSSLVGTDVKNNAGENLGEIKDLMINTADGSISYAVLSFGGIMGIGDKYFAIPWKSFSVDRQDESLILNASKERMENAPGFDKDNWPSDANHEYLTRVNDYYTSSVY